MKVAHLLFPVAGSAAVIQERQLDSLVNTLSGGRLVGMLNGLLGGSNGSIGLSSITSMISNPVGSTQLKAELNPAAKRVQLRWGPFELAGQNDPKDPNRPKDTMDPTGISIKKMLTGVCTGCTVLSATSWLTFQNGSRASAAEGVYTHHLFTAAVGKKAYPTLMCTNGAKGKGEGAVAAFMASGEDKPPFLFMDKNDQKSGYKIGSMTPTIVIAEIVNYNPDKQSVYLTADMEFIEGAMPGMQDTSISLLSVTGCAKDQEYKPPPGVRQHSKKSENFVVPTDGTMLNALGHLHDGGAGLEMFINDKLICDAKPTYGTPSGVQPAMEGGHSHGGRKRAEKPQTIVSMSQCIKEPVPLKKGDIITLNARYDLDAHPLRESGGEEMGGMGIMIVTIAHAPM